MAAYSERGEGGKSSASLSLGFREIGRLPGLSGRS